ncbi:MAG: type II toxin-antitoxin system HicA family toxin [Lamprobacter sp.]|uniref:type II toxin-antitoxin system HicA family toxin n=1 Tax=Lamprobacter sp. TaxID=3100796 RepID=UPI002B259C2D|nr:type II toxin-antitoxin system HicA family toxin [Lamprobacter sp.]MEA3641711.1 type II toxin-antitoxin system HicA family toxin [Lamprobacter sp.]
MKRDKRIAALRANPKAVRFEDACRIAEALGFECQGGQGSHQTYGRVGEPVLLNFQNRAGYIKPYQARQLIEMVEKYESGQ